MPSTGPFRWSPFSTQDREGLLREGGHRRGGSLPLRAGGRPEGQSNNGEQPGKHVEFCLVWSLCFLGFLCILGLSSLARKLEPFLVGLDFKMPQKLLWLPATVCGVGVCSQVPLPLVPAEICSK